MGKVLSDSQNRRKTQQYIFHLIKTFIPNELISHSIARNIKSITISFRTETVYR